MGLVHHERLGQLISANRGIVRTAEAVAAGISKPVFYGFIRDRNFKKVAHGVYAAPDAWIDPMYLLGLRSRQVVFSHETALFLHDLTGPPCPVPTGLPAGKPQRYGGNRGSRAHRLCRISQPAAESVESAGERDAAPIHGITESLAGGKNRCDRHAAS